MAINIGIPSSNKDHYIFKCQLTLFKRELIIYVLTKSLCFRTKVDSNFGPADFMTD